MKSKYRGQGTGAKSSEWLLKIGLKIGDTKIETQEREIKQ
jgi:hypothetical protein